LRAGFTLLELLVSLAVAALLVTLVLPHMPAGLTAGEFAGAARELTAALREARSIAVNRNRDIAFAFAFADGPGGYRFAGRESTFPAGIRVALAGGDGRVMWFFPDGTASGGEILMSRGEARIVIAVDEMTGSVARADLP